MQPQKVIITYLRALPRDVGENVGVGVGVGVGDGVNLGVGVRIGADESILYH